MKYRNSFNSGNDYYDVEKIITRKYNGSKKYYLIKWEGYPLKDCTWEPASNLDNIPEMVEDFDNNFPKSIDKLQLKKYLRLRHERKKNRIKKKLKLKFNSINKDDNTKNNLFITINISGNHKEEEQKKQDDIIKEIQIPLCNDENKNEEIKLLNINDTEKNDKPKNNNIISFSIEDEITDNNDAPKLIEPIIIW
jgi:hypothetical protein